MSRRRASWRPYEGPTDEQLDLIRYGRVQAVPLDDDDDDNLIYTPQWWLALIVAAMLGVALLPVAYAAVWLGCWIAGVR